MNDKKYPKLTPDYLADLIPGHMHQQFVPSLIRALRIDPKIAAGPIALACIDICTLLYYFNIMNILAN